MENRLAEERADKFISAIREKKIVVDNRPNHGRDFFGPYEQLHKHRFYSYLGSCSRYIENKYIEERKYHG